MRLRMLAAALGMAVALVLGMIVATPAHAADPPVGGLEVTVVWSDGTPAEGVEVNAYHSTDDVSVFGETGPSGKVSWSEVAVGDWLIDAWTADGSATSAAAEVHEGQTSEVTLELVAPIAGLSVQVVDSMFGGPVGGAQVVLSKGDATVATESSDESGRVQFVDLAPGEYAIAASKNGYVAAAPLTVEYVGGHDSYSIALEPRLSCEPPQPNQGLTNMGFEDGLTGWTIAREAEGISAVEADGFTTPWEGTHMARLGTPRDSNAEQQSPGPNILCQDFVVDKAQENFAFNVFTYDYTGFDEFHFDLVVTDPESGERLAAYTQGAWGQGTELKTSGWRGLTLNLAEHQGETVRLSIRAGGTLDDLYAFWAYVDSAETKRPPTVETTIVDIETATGSVSTDPTTGQWTASFPVGTPSDLTLTFVAECAIADQQPTSVALLLNGKAYEATHVSGKNYKATIPAAEMANGQVSRSVGCDDAATLVTTIGQIVLYDPSGYVTDVITGKPVPGAEVHLYKVEDWTPQTTVGPPASGTCQTNESKNGGPWNQPAPTQP